jgi:hypothetical protein
LQSRRISWLALAALAGAALGVPAAAGEAEQPAPAPEAVPLERLLKIPGSVVAPPAEPRRGGKTRAEWQARFRQVQGDLATSRKALDDSRKQLEEVAPDEAWSMSAPGLPVNSAPAETSIDFRLRQQIRRQREEVERAERALDDLGIEANLAEVPDDWRVVEDAAGSAPGGTGAGAGEAGAGAGGQAGGGSLPAR